LRYAAEDEGTVLPGPLELVTLSGTVEAGGMHLHVSVSDARGEVRGGHLMPGCIVRTTAELVIGLLQGWEFSRPVDAATGYKELLVTRRSR
jgi:predicted DNA-binding protein with PD1-like motif